MQLKPNEDPELDAELTKGKGKAQKSKTPQPERPPERLPRAPAEVVRDGRPAFGAYLGAVDQVGYGALRDEWRKNKLWQLAHHKRWTWAGAANQDCFFAVAIFQAGYVGNVFAHVFDRRAKTFAVKKATMAVPGVHVKVGERPANGLAATYKRGKVTVALSRDVGSRVVHAKLAWDDFTAELDFACKDEAPLTAICPVTGGGIMNTTHKTGPLPVTGVVAAGGKRFLFDGTTVGHGSLDYTNGLLARETAWRWASAWGRLANGPLMGLNLVSGFNQPGAEGGTGENALWLDGDLIPVGAATINFDPARATDGAWRVTTADGVVDLTFTPEGSRGEAVDFKLVKSVYVQPMGTFSGTVKHPSGKVIEVAGLPGVTEDHQARW